MESKTMTTMTIADILSAINGSNNSFARSIADQIRAGRRLSERQVIAITDFIQKQRKPETVTVTITLPSIRKAFDVAIEGGVKKPILRVGEYTFKAAPEGGKNPGAIYVTLENLWIGTIDQTGQWKRGRQGEEAHEVDMMEIDRNPVEALQKHGRQTGFCGICGRVLTDPVSVREGIGPICKSKWGM